MAVAERMHTGPGVIVQRVVPGAWSGMMGRLLLVLAGVAIVALSAQVRIPLPFTPVPISGQTFAVLLVGASLGATLGGTTLVLYLLVGVVGAPVFTDLGSGVGHLTGPTGGYLVGFAVAAVLVGALAERGYDRRLPTALIGMAAASAVIYLFGAGWLMISLGFDADTAVARGIAPFLLGDVLKLALAAGILPLAWRAIGHPERGAGHDR